MCQVADEILEVCETSVSGRQPMALVPSSSDAGGSTITAPALNRPSAAEAVAPAPEVLMTKDLSG